MEIVENRSSRRKVYLVLGYFVLLTGSFLPDDLRTKIIDAANWGHEKGLWEEKFIRERKFYLKDLQNKIRAHKPGVILHLVRLKNANDEDFTEGVIGIDQFWDYIDSGRIYSIKRINLDSCNLTEIPTPVFDLKLLETFSFENNKLSKIPPRIGDLRSLKRLYLNRNQLKTLPTNLIHLESLEVLSLEKNFFKALPSFIIELKSLKKLYLRNNFIFEIPNFLQKYQIITVV